MPHSEIATRSRTTPRRRGRHARLPPARARPPVHPVGAELLAWAGLVVASCGAAAWLFYETARFTFFRDEWAFIVRRENDVETFLVPHGEHLTLVPVAIYKLLLNAVGLDGYWAFRLVLIAAHLAVAAFLFELVRRRVGSVGALAAAAVLLFLGPAWEDILWPFQVNILGAVAAGLAMLLVLETRGKASDAAAAALATLSLAFGSIGIAFLAGASVEVLARTDRWRRVWIVGVPGLLYGAWYVAYGQSSVTFSNLIETPAYVAESSAEAIGAVTSLGREWGRPLAVVLAFLVVSRVVGRAGSTRLWSTVTIALSFWTLTGLARATNPEAPPGSSRYLYPGAVFIILIAAELFRRPRLNTRAAAILAVAAAAVVLGNAGAIYPAKLVRETNAQYLSAELAAIELARGVVDPGFVPDPDWERLLGPGVAAGNYLSLVAAHGSFADEPREILQRPPEVRAAADVLLAAAMRLALEPVPALRSRGPTPRVLSPVGGVASRQGCVVFDPGRDSNVLELQAPRTGLAIEAGTTAVEVRVRRFAEGYAAVVGSAAPHTSAVLRLPPDDFEGPWYASVTAASRTRICGLR